MTHPDPRTTPKHPGQRPRARWRAANAGKTNPDRPRVRTTS